MLYMVTCTINIPPMLAYIPYMDPMGNIILHMNPSWFDFFACKKRSIHGLIAQSD